MARTWYYVDKNDQEIGPVDAAEIRARVADRTIVKSTMVWRDDLPDWVEAGRIRKLVAVMPDEQPASASHSERSRPVESGSSHAASERTSSARRVARRPLNLDGAADEWDELAAPEPIASDDPFAFHDASGQVMRSFERPKPKQPKPDPDESEA